MAKFDPFHHKEKYLSWKERAQSEIADLTEYNSKIFMKYITDMECGLNVAAHQKKGSRSYLRLNAIRTRILYLNARSPEELNASVGLFRQEMDKYLSRYDLLVQDKVHHWRQFSPGIARTLSALAS